MASTFRDYYKTLEVPRTATDAEIKQAFRRLARQHHPDLHPEKEKELHTKRMQEINEAYSVLSSPENRAKYDQLGEHWQDPPSPGGYGGQVRHEGGPDRQSPEGNEGFSDFFRNMFRQAEGGEAASDFFPSDLDVEAELELSLEEAVRGVEKNFRLMTTGLCTNCHGTGRKGKTLCPVCGGVGEIQRPREIKSKIPAGLLDAGRIRLKGQGNEGKQGRGDLYLTIHLLPDPRFTVDGKNLETQLRIMPWQAALGSQATVQTLDGPVKVRISKGTQAGKRLRLPGKGLGKPDARGNLFIRIEIDIPESISPKAEALWKQLEEENG